MRLLGIDYGGKRAGVATSSGRMAFPLEVIINNQSSRLRGQAITKLAQICQEKKISKIIVGRSLNYKREPNPIMKDVESFVAELRSQTNLPVEFEDETLTSAQAGRHGGDDSAAAALILQSYIDRIKE